MFAMQLQKLPKFEGPARACLSFVHPALRFACAIRTIPFRIDPLPATIEYAVPSHKGFWHQVDRDRSLKLIYGYENMKQTWQ
jgi:hypothetical protein